MTMTKHERFWKARLGGRRNCALVLLAVASCWFLSSGCQTSTNMRLGQRAEQCGYYHEAYEYYCDEAKRRPSSGAVRVAIARSAPRAAQYYERQATCAADAGDYADAWKLYMQALTITPDNSAVARLIRMLEEHHLAAVGPAKAGWMKQGAIALAVAPATSSQHQYPIPARTTAAEPDAPSVPQTTSELEATQRRPDEPAAVVAATHLSPRRTPDHQVDAVAQAAPASEDQAPPPAPPIDAVAKAAPVTNDRTPPPARSGAAGNRGRSEAHGTDTDSAYLMTAILSVNDWRFPRRTHTVDDLHVRLKDTDHDPDADLDIYMGTKRVHKARDVEPGQAIHVVGRSGKSYEIVVITVVDRTESARIGIRPHTGARD